jgi:hypothetical protein
LLVWDSCHLAYFLSFLQHTIITHKGVVLTNKIPNKNFFNNKSLFFWLFRKPPYSYWQCWLNVSANGQYNSAVLCTPCPCFGWNLQTTLANKTIFILFKRMIYHWLKYCHFIYTFVGWDFPLTLPIWVALISTFFLYIIS